MKKIITILAIVCLSLTACISLASCGGEETKTYEGEYSYVNPYDETSSYGVKVQVKVAGQVIKSVMVIPSDYHEVTDSWAGKELWLSGKNDFLTRFKGMTIEQLNAIKVECDEKGVPTEIDGDITIVSGASQSSGRLIKAVQNAVKTNA